VTTVKTEAQKWGETAILFICSATATVIFLGAGYFLRPIPSLAIASCVAAGLCFLIFAIKGIAIVRWWFVLAKRNQPTRPEPPLPGPG
jgi:hypothetical protein